jgi:hypothetical protein
LKSLFSSAEGKPLSWALFLLTVTLPLSIGAMNVALALVTLAVMLRGRKADWREALGAPAACLLVYVLISALVAAAGEDPARSVRHVPKDLHKLWVAVVLAAALRLAPRARCAEGLALGFTAAAVVGLGQALFVRGGGGEWIRAHAFVHPVTYGEQLALGLLGAFCFAAFSERRRRVAVILLPLIAAAFILNQTRGAFAAVAVGVSALMLADKGLRRWLPLAAGCGLGVLIVWELLPTGRSFIGHLRLYGSDFVANQQFNRLIFWKVAWGMFTDHLWLGVGQGNYQIFFERYFQGTIAEQRVWGSAHNLYFHQAARPANPRSAA